MSRTIDVHQHFLPDFFWRETNEGASPVETVPSFRGSAGAAFSTLIVVARHPRPDVRGTIAKDNTASRVVLSQETDGVTIGEEQIRQIENRDAISRLGVDQLAQFVDTVRVKLTTDPEDNRSADRAMNSQHWPRCAERNCQAS